MSGLFFPQGFLWGTATSSYQIEGAVREGERGESIWDRFCRVPGKVAHGDTGEVACDHYHRYRDDVENLKQLGVGGYRFSTAWPRIFPAGRGRPNRKGIDFYLSLTDELLRRGIRPALTLYHWDLPQALEDGGGWGNRDTADWFAEYAVTMYRALGDRVKTWITLNEPWVSAFLGHYTGEHAPGKTDFALAVQASHVLLLAHAKAVEAFRQEGCDGAIGITLNLSPVYPLADGEGDGEAARIADGYRNRWFLDPVFLGSYPADMLSRYEAHGSSPRIGERDMALMRDHPPDFLGVNYYSPCRVRHARTASVLPFEEGMLPEAPVTDMGWEILPEGLYDLLIRIKADYGDPRILITENGCACRDEARVGVMEEDRERIEYLASHLAAAHRAIQAGVKLEGYYLWSLMDNFEWAFGYTRRFGITGVDFATQARTWKRSAAWYQAVIASNALGEG